MRKVKVMSLDKLEVTNGEIRIFANSGDLVLAFPQALWENVLTEASSPSETTPEDLGWNNVEPWRHRWAPITEKRDSLCR
ncbi:MAG: hypothetical protein QOI57_1159 [Rubrobacteraceae bacterium]|jgi:hypothetical protein|nr:hypothetical protein [Rubrobacteraceae bacterium]